MEVKRLIETGNMKDYRYTDVQSLNSEIYVSEDFITQDNIDVLSYFFRGKAFNIICYPRYKHTLRMITDEVAGLEGVMIRQETTSLLSLKPHYLEVCVSEEYSSNVYYGVVSMVQRNRDVIRKIVIDAYNNNETKHDRGYNYEVIEKTILFDYNGFSSTLFEDYGMGKITDHPLRVALADELIWIVMNEFPDNGFETVTLTVNHDKNPLGDTIKFRTYVEVEKHLDLKLNEW